MDNKKAVFGIYSTRDGVERATDQLLHAGFTANDISVLLPESLRTPTSGVNVATMKDGRVVRETGPGEIGTEKSTKAPEGATTGAVSGATVGGVLGLLAGIGALAIPGVGPFIAAGPIMATLAGMGVGGAVGGLTGALIGMGIPEFEAKKYEGRLKTGGILFSVHCATSEQVTRAKEILKSTNAEDVSSTGEASVKDEDRKRGAVAGE
jgi:uncharacterized membrane protein